MGRGGIRVSAMGGRGRGPVRGEGLKALYEFGVKMVLGR